MDRRAGLCGSRRWRSRERRDRPPRACGVPDGQAGEHDPAQRPGPDGARHDPGVGRRHLRRQVGSAQGSAQHAPRDRWSRDPLPLRSAFRLGTRRVRGARRGAAGGAVAAAGGAVLARGARRDGIPARDTGAAPHGRAAGPVRRRAGRLPRAHLLGERRAGAPARARRGCRARPRGSHDPGLQRTLSLLVGHSRARVAGVLGR